MIHTGLVKRSANRANEKQMYPEMTYAQAQKLKLKKKLSNLKTASMDV